MQEVRLQITLRQRWTDPNLVHTSSRSFVSLVGSRAIGSIWTPDIFIRQSKESELMGWDKTNAYARISPDGSVLYSTR